MLKSSLRVNIPSKPALVTNIVRAAGLLSLQTQEAPKRVVANLESVYYHLYLPIVIPA